ncbi:hypothetical protein [Microbulbifer sp. THAF38]|uniref:hypothetical protein n=1 Tax=Microbulbifer sp. THAF38 TaxID=2587856 RepID=UPI001267DE87|nr:hypothetical protein [Microbulbifer sp. THAF38]QFT55797.1 hypothetical protein FIU95_14700 [Microbulbifer sp. THAF38]
MEGIFEVAAAIIASIGASSVIIISLSSWLGKVWANRVLENEKHQLAEGLEKAKRELDVLKERTLRFQNDKIIVYRSAIDIIANLLATIEAYQDGKLSTAEAENLFALFNEKRIQVYGYLAMMAPQEVMDAQDDLIDYLLVVINSDTPYDWRLVRAKSLALLNTVRKDIGVTEQPIVYNGQL